MSQKNSIAPASTSIPSVVSRPSRRHGRITQNQIATSAATGTTTCSTVKKSWVPALIRSGPGSVGRKLAPAIQLPSTESSKASSTPPSTAQARIGRNWAAEGRCSRSAMLAPRVRRWSEGLRYFRWAYAHKR